MATVYGSGGSSRVRATVTLGNNQSGYVFAKRGSGGRFSSGVDAVPVYPDVWRWPSFRVKTNEFIRGPVSNLMRNINRWSKHVMENADAVLYNAMVPAYNRSRLYCPKDTKLLVNSSVLATTVAGERGGQATVSLSYGAGGAVWYAIYTHEMISYKHAAPTRAKFLESAIREQMSQIRTDLYKGARDLSGGGGV